MKLVNGRYRVNELLSKNRTYTVYEAVDLSESSKQINICIFTSGLIESELMRFLISRFEKISQNASRNTIKILNFGIVNNENIKSDHKDYFYVTEDINEYTSLTDYAIGATENQLIDVFSKVCNIAYDQSCSYYRVLPFQLENIYVSKDGNIKLKDEITNLLECNEMGICSYYSSMNKGTDSVDTLVPNKINYIESLSAILSTIAVINKTKTKDLMEYRNILNYINKNYVDRVDEILGTRLSKLVLRLHRNNIEEKYSNIFQIFEDINDIYGTDYKYNGAYENCQLALETPLIGREEEVKLISRYINNCYKSDDSKNVIIVHGEIGIGKTRLLDHIGYLMENDANIDSIHLNDKDNHKDFILSILNNIVRNSDRNLTNKYKKELVTIGLESGDNEFSGITDDYFIDYKTRLILVVKLIGLLEEYYSDKKGLIIIDNVDKYDEYTFSLIDYIINRESIRNRLVLVISYRDGDCLKNKEFTKFLSDIEHNVNLSMHLRPLPENECVDMIRAILNVHEITDEFVSTFYKYSMGNPLFIETALKDLISRKKVYFDNDTGKWKRKMNPEIYMPSNMESMCKNQLKNIDVMEYKILYNMSLFYMPISTEIISQLLEMDLDIIQKCVNKLIVKGILYSSISDNGFVYTFYNKFFRNFLYQEINEEQCLSLHRKIYNILIKHYENDKNIYIEEIIYHLEKLKNEEELLPYYKENEKRLVKQNSIHEAINCNNKILRIISGLDNKEKYIDDEISSNINLAKLYEKCSDKVNCIYYYEQSIKMCIDNGYDKRAADIINELIWNYADVGNEEEVKRYTKELKEIAEKINYKKGYLEYLKIIIRNNYNNQEYKDVKRISSYALELCSEEYLELKVQFENYYCDALVMENKLDEAIERLKSVIRECTINNYKDSMSRLYNSLGVLYSDYIQNGEEALKSFSMQYDLSKDDVIRAYGCNSIANMGFVNYVLLNYSEAYDNFNEGSVRAVKGGVVYDNFYDYVYMGSIMYKVGKYYEAFRYASLCESYAGKNAMFGQELLPYKIFQYYLCTLIGEDKKREEVLQEGIKLFDGTTSIMKYKINLIYLLDRLIKSKEGITVKDVIDASEKILYIDLRISMINNGILRLINLGNYATAGELFEYVSSLKSKTNKNENRFMLDCIGCMLKKYDSSILIEDIGNYKDVKNPTIIWSANYLIGQWYYINNNLTMATIYLSEACDIILELLKQIPIEFKKSYILNNMMMVKAYEMLSNLKFYYNNENQCGDNGLSQIKVNDNIENVFQIIMDTDFVNESFISSVKEQLWANLKNINSIEDLIENISSVTFNNVNLICQYITFISMATRTCIITEKNNKFCVISSSDGSLEMPKDISIINIARSRATEIKLSKKYISDGYGNNISYEIDGAIKSAMCIPIAPMLKASGVSKYDYNHNVLGYIYVESDRRLNNINDETLKKCMVLGRILYMIIDKNNIRSSSTIDKLTATLTRRYLELFVHEQIDRSLNLNYEFSTIMIDIDKFKGINDTYGHRTGDVVLRNLCRVIMKSIRHGDVIGRYGGEEFLIVLPNTGIEEAFKIAERIRNKIEEAKLMGDKRMVTVSLGVSTYPLHASSYEELIEKADQALYEAKNSGRNRTRIWNESYGTKISTTNKLSGIFIGNGTQDYRNVSTVIEFIDLINEDSPWNKKISVTIDRIHEIMDADVCALFLIKQGELEKIYSSISGPAVVDEDQIYNYNKFKDVVAAGENVCGIDWSTINKDYDDIKIPDLKSIIIVPLKDKDEVIGLIYLSVDINHKEFTYDELNFVSTLGKIMVPILKQENL